MFAAFMLASTILVRVQGKRCGPFQPLPLLKVLVKHDPDLVFSKDDRGETPLHLAAEWSHKDVAEFLLANKYPEDKKYCHNALVFAPDKTVLQSLKEIETFDKAKVIPQEYINWLDKYV